MELSIFDGAIFTVPPYPITWGVLPHDLGLLATTPEATRPVGGAGRHACNHLRYPSPQAHEQENEELAFLTSFKNVQSTLPYMHM